PRHVHTEDARELGERDHAVRDAALEHGAFGVLLVEVRGIEVAGNLSELLHVGIAHGVFEAESVAHVQVVDALAGARQRIGHGEFPLRSGRAHSFTEGCAWAIRRKHLGILPDDRYRAAATGAGTKGPSAAVAVSSGCMMP